MQDAQVHVTKSLPVYAFKSSVLASDLYRQMILMKLGNVLVRPLLCQALVVWGYTWQCRLISVIDVDIVEKSPPTVVIRFN